MGALRLEDGSHLFKIKIIGVRVKFKARKFTTTNHIIITSLYTRNFNNYIGTCSINHLKYLD